MKQKTFKEYTATKKSRLHPFTSLKQEVSDQQYPSMGTVFGVHSAKSDQQYPSMATQFGSHSVEKLQEEVATQGTTASEQIAQHSPKETESIHDKNKINETKHLVNYTYESYNINSALHNKNAAGEIENHIHGIDKSLDEMRLDRDTHVYTGIEKSPARHFGETGSAKVHLPAYTSTSTSYKRARGFSGEVKHSAAHAKKHTPLNSEVPTLHDGEEVKHVLKIHLPKGTKAGSVKHFSHHGYEEEILLHRGHNIEIHPHPTVDEKGTHVWHARVISHTPDKV